MSSKEPVRILVVDDEEVLCTTLHSLITKHLGFKCETFTDPEEAFRSFQGGYYSAAIVDLTMPKIEGMSLIPMLRSSDENLPFIVLTAHGQWENTVEAMRRGAFSFLTKPFSTDEVKNTLEHAVRLCALRRELAEVGEQEGVHIIGRSPGVRKVLDLIQKVAPTDSTVLVSGESGTGKELVARSIHLGSPRRHNTFVAVNCGAFPDSLLESELFGHAKGAFTTALSDKVGMFEVANKGTFFLDEIGDTSQVIQVKLLRVLETREIRPVGSTQTRRIDTRIIAASNRNLEEEVARGNFRFDLFYRLNVIPIHIPPLRERKEDIPMLVGHFISRMSRRGGRKYTSDNITPEAWSAIESYSWPGNIRELENVINRALTLMVDGRICPDDLGLTPQLQQQGRGAIQVEAAPPQELQIGPNFSLDRHMEEVEIRFIRRALDLTDGNMTEAAKLLGVTFRTFRYKVAKLRIKEQ